MVDELVRHFFVASTETGLVFGVQKMVGLVVLWLWLWFVLACYIIRVLPTYYLEFFKFFFRGVGGRRKGGMEGREKCEGVRMRNTSKQGTVAQLFPVGGS